MKRKKTRIRYVFGSTKVCGITEYLKHTESVSFVNVFDMCFKDKFLARLNLQGNFLENIINIINVQLNHSLIPNKPASSYIENQRVTKIVSAFCLICNHFLFILSCIIHEFYT